MKNDNSFIYIIILIAAVFVLSKPSLSDIQTKSFYFMYCDDFKSKMSECASGKLLNKIEALVLIERQIVVINSVLPETFNNCSIFNENNWICSDDVLKLSVANGQYFELLIKDNEFKNNRPLFAQIPAFYYYYLSTMNFFNDIKNLFK